MPVATTLPAVQTDRAVDLARLRVRLTYLWRHGRLPELDAPTLFTELIQRRKLSERDMRMPLFADKVAVKAIVADRLGPEWVIPTIWEGKRLPAHEQWPRPFVVKARHGCNQIAFVRDGDCWADVRRRAQNWVGTTYGKWLDEWLYDHIAPGLLVEPLMGPGPGLPIDYKVYVFGGTARFVQVHLGRGARHRWIVMDRDWVRTSSRTGDPDPERPGSLAQMLAAAEELARGFDFVRVDLYEIERRPLFGEVTFYPGSGLDRFDPVNLDQVMGHAWLEAISARERADPAGIGRSAVAFLHGLDHALDVLALPAWQDEDAVA